MKFSPALLRERANDLRRSSSEWILDQIREALLAYADDLESRDRRKGERRKGAQTEIQTEIEVGDLIETDTAHGPIRGTVTEIEKHFTRFFVVDLGKGLRTMTWSEVVRDIRKVDRRSGNERRRP